MDGYTLLYKLRHVLNESSTSSFLDEYTSYHYLNEAAVELAIRTKLLTATQEITTVADQSAYDLNSDYMGLSAKNSENRFFAKLNDGTNDRFIFWKDYNEILYSNQTTSVAIPSSFTIRDDPTLADRATGTATSAGAATGGESTLTDSAADFTDVNAGDVVHNTTDGSTGMVLSKTSTTALVTALFNGTDDDWTSSDAYVIQPSGRMQVVLDPPPSTAGYTLTMYYTKRPGPLYSDYGVFKFPPHLADALVKYAVWLYKYRDREPDTADTLFQYWDRQVGVYGSQMRSATNKRLLTVNKRARR